MVYRKSMLTYFARLAIVFLTVLALFIISSVFGLLTGASLRESFSGFGDDFLNTFIPLAYIWFGFYYLWVPYREFKLGMQNGQTRHQIWLSQILGIITTTIFNFLLWLAAGGWHYQTITPYFGTFLILIDVVSLAYAVGSGFALLSRKWKIIVGIATPTVILIVLVQIVRLLINFWHPSAATLQALSSLVDWSGSWVLCGLLWLAIMIGLSYLFTMRQQLRRD